MLARWRAAGALALALGLLGGLQACFYDAGPLEARACNRDTDCNAGQICGGGYCQEDDGQTPSTVCNADAECDDGLFCNGVEACEPGSPNANVHGCLAGEAPDPDDGIDCTRDRCDDALDMLVHEDTALCECDQDADCQGPCQRGVCDLQRQCTFAPLEAGVACEDDGAACTSDERCDGQGRCVGTPNDALCDDGLYCNGAEVCDPGSARADADGCATGDEQPLDDGVACTLDACDEETDRATHDPAACECETPGEACPVPSSVCTISVCNERFECELQALALGSGCDDGAACTTDDQCDERGVCLGTPDEGACGDGLYCNGPERCDPTDPNADEVLGCVLDPEPTLDDGDDCTLDACDEANDRVTHARVDGCLACDEDADCAPNECQLRGHCEEGACVFEPKPEGAGCGSGAACDQSACDGEGACVPALDDGRCQAACRADAACAPEDPSADEEGCVFGPQDGGACQRACGVVAAGTCDEGVCLIPAEGPTGEPGCGDGLDNDCDGLTDAADSDCWVPDEVEITTTTDGGVGLGEGDGAGLVVVARRNGQPATSQARNLACVARPLVYSQGFDAGALASDPLLHPTLGASESNLTLGDRVRDGQSYPNTTARGLTLCDGYGVRIGGFNTADLQANARSYIVSVTMGNLASQGLGADQRLVLSYRTSGGTKVGEEVRYLPLVAIGDNEDRALQTYEFALYIGSNFGALDLRLEVLSASNAFPQRACAFVDEVRLETIPRVPLVENDGITRERLQWSWGGTTEASGQTFQPNLDWAAFFGPDPAAGHNLMSGNGYGIVSKGLRWIFGPAQNAPLASLAFPAPSLPEALLEGDEVARARYRSSPLIFDFAMRSVNTTWAAGEVTDITLLEEQAAQPRKLATALPLMGRPAYYASHYEVMLKSHNRYYAVLPPSALPLVGRELRAARPPFATRTAGVDLDEVNLYSFGRVWDNDARAWVEEGPDPTAYSASVQSMTAGPVRVQCFWQDLDDPATPTRSSAPVTLTFR
jgi:hypothetical protein